jgi:hypothetical protein
MRRSLKPNGFLPLLLAGHQESGIYPILNFLLHFAKLLLFDLIRQLIASRNLICYKSP